VAHYIFPTLGSVAFLVYDLAEVATNLMRFDSALKRITQLKDTFRNAYVCVIMNHSNSAEARTFMKLQFRYNPRLLAAVEIGRALSLKRVVVQIRFQAGLHSVSKRG
jgi:hypothetical protein